jgi:hypothetical protein
VSNSSNVNFERLSRSTSTSVIPWPDFAKPRDKAEQIQIIYFPENVQLPYLPQLPHTPIPTHPFISGLQEERQIQPRSTPFSAFHSSSYPEHVYEPRLTVPEPPNGPEPSLSRPEPPPSSMALQQQQPSEHMDVDYPRHLIPEPAQAQGQQVSLALNLFPPAYTSYNPPVTQDQSALRQFFDARCSNDAPGFPSPHCSLPYSPPVLGHISASLATSDQEGHALPSISPVPTTSVAQSPINQPLQDHNVTEPSAFNVLPDTAATYESHVDLAFHPAAAPPPYSEYALAQPIVQNIPLTVTPPGRTSSPHQEPEGISRPSSPANSVRAIGER